MKNNNLALWLPVVVACFALSFAPFMQTAWEVPAKYKKMENPTKADKENISIAKGLYEKHCKSCHGKVGLGDGPKAKELDTPSGDFSKAKFQSQSDGELFYKTTFGRDDMPAYEKKISSDEDRWILVHYLRTFKQ
ncbi:MAG TPA: cytochrome C [Cytophagales bacterium]|nr:cytochrome C [Cytophagales bacterium]HCR53680.1 cytochrome C [Cytophagales bacterium]